MIAQHDIRVLIAGAELTNWTRYEIESDLLQPADAWSITLSNVAGAMAGKVPTFAATQVIVDGTLQMTGYVDRVEYSSDTQAATVTITGRDRFGQLVDSSAPPRNYNNVTLVQLATTLAASHILVWSVDNEQNRAELQQAASRVSALKRAGGSASSTDATATSKSPTVTAKLSRAQRHLALVKKRVYHKVKIEPGEKIFDVLQRCAERSRLLLWCGADGNGIIAQPNYQQSVAGYLRHYPQTSQDADKGNVLDSRVTLSGAERFSEYRALATAGNTRTNFARASRYDHTEADATVPIDRPHIFTAEAQRQGEIADAALREMQRRKFEATELTYTVRGHTQGDKLWATDTLVAVDDQVNGIEGTFYITARRFEGGPDGQRTVLTARPKDLLLA